LNTSVFGAPHPILILVRTSSSTKEMFARENAGGCRQADVGSIVDRFSGSLYRFAVCLTRNESDAVDLVRQSFVTLNRRPHQIHDFSEVERSLFTTLHRNFLTAMRRRSSYPKGEFLPGVHDFAKGHPESGKFSDAPELLSAFSRVDETCRGAVGLFYLSNLSYREIAEILEISIDSLMSRLSKGKEQLGSILKTRSDE
jgi:RNA polymerase sigma-70 factor, ECF subfamily